MTTRLDITGGEKYLGFARKQLRYLQGWLQRAGLTSGNRHFDLGDADVHVSSVNGFGAIRIEGDSGHLMVKPSSLSGASRVFARGRVGAWESGFKATNYFAGADTGFSRSNDKALSSLRAGLSYGVRAATSIHHLQGPAGIEFTNVHHDLIRSSFVATIRGGNKAAVANNNPGDLVPCLAREFSVEYCAAMGISGPRATLLAMFSDPQEYLNDPHVVIEEWPDGAKYTNLLAAGRLLLEIDLKQIDEVMSVPGMVLDFNASPLNQIHDLGDSLPHHTGPPQYRPDEVTVAADGMRMRLAVGLYAFSGEPVVGSGVVGGPSIGLDGLSAGYYETFEDATISTIEINAPNDAPGLIVNDVAPPRVCMTQTTVYDEAVECGRDIHGSSQRSTETTTHAFEIAGWSDEWSIALERQSREQSYAVKWLGGDSFDTPQGYGRAKEDAAIHVVDIDVYADEGAVEPGDSVTISLNFDAAGNLVAPGVIDSSLQGGVIVDKDGVYRSGNLRVEVPAPYYTANISGVHDYAHWSALSIETNIDIAGYAVGQAITITGPDKIMAVVDNGAGPSYPPAGTPLWTDMESSGSGGHSASSISYSWRGFERPTVIFEISDGLHIVVGEPTAPDYNDGLARQAPVYVVEDGETVFESGGFERSVPSYIGESTQHDLESPPLDNYMKVQSGYSYANRTLEPFIAEEIINEAILEVDFAATTTGVNVSIDNEISLMGEALFISARNRFANGSIVAGLSACRIDKDEYFSLPSLTVFRRRGDAYEVGTCFVEILTSLNEFNAAVAAYVAAADASPRDSAAVEAAKAALAGMCNVLVNNFASLDDFARYRGAYASLVTA